MPRGGARPNSGPKKGAKYRSTRSKEEGREALRQIVMREMEALVGAQVANAKGLSYLVVRDRVSGKFVRVPSGAADKLDPTQEVIEIWEKDPSVQAFTDLLNRALDKPKEQEQEVSVRHTVDIVDILRRRKARADSSRD